MKIIKPYLSFRLCVPLLATAPYQTGLAEEPLFTLAPCQDNLELGVAFAMVGDVNADGVDDLAITDRSARINGLPGSGMVYIVSGVDGSPLRDHVGVPVMSQAFGASLASLDADGDGILDLAVGAPGQRDAVGTMAGCVYIYSGTDGRLLRAITGNAGSQLGSSLANAGDQNGDGADDLYAGAPLASGSRGAVFVLSGADGSTLRSIVAPTSVSSFGVALAALGDVDGDGLADVAVSAPYYRVGTNLAGRVALFKSADGSVAAEIMGDKPYNCLGYSLVATPDANGDGQPDLLVGSFSGGSAFLLSGADFGLLRDLSIPTLPTYQNLNVGGGLDFDGDNQLDFLIGLPALPSINSTLASSIRVVSGADGSSMFEFTDTVPNSGLGMRMAILPGLGFAAGEPNLKDPTTGGYGFARVWKVASDSDGDGVSDNLDAIPHSIMTPTVWILGMDSGVANTVNDQGITLADRIAGLGDVSSFRNPALYQVAVIHLATGLVDAGLLTQDEWRKLQSTAVLALRSVRTTR